MKDSKIEWTHHTFNPWWGCTKVSEGCKNCYADTFSKRIGKDLWGPKGARPVTSDKYWAQPIKWNADAENAGERHRVFCASMSDVFEGPETMPKDAWEKVSEARERLGKLIDQTPNLDWLLLTKRPENVLKFGPLGHRWSMEGLPENVWIGTSVENQEQSDKRIPELLQCPAAVRFLSCEPLLGPVELGMDGPELGWVSYLKPPTLNGQMMPGIHWVICGGESGHGARPMHPDWARSLRDQCQKAGVPFFFKQWGEYSPYYEKADTESGRIVLAELPHGETRRVGKKAAGRLLDGREWNEFPEVDL